MKLLRGRRLLIAGFHIISMATHALKDMWLHAMWMGLASNVVI